MLIEQVEALIGGPDLYTHGSSLGEMLVEYIKRSKGMQSFWDNKEASGPMAELVLRQRAVYRETLAEADALLRLAA